MLGLDLSSVLEVLLGVASAVGHLHTMNVVHGDIKADNVMLKSDPQHRAGFVPKCDAGLGHGRALRRRG